MSKPPGARLAEIASLLLDFPMNPTGTPNPLSGPEPGISPPTTPTSAVPVPAYPWTEASLAVAGDEAQIFALVARGQQEQAKAQLLDLIGSSARNRDFHTAERLRQRIYEIDNLALNEAIRAGEIIEQEKQRAIKGEDLEIWAQLRQQLGNEAFQSLYHEFSTHRYQAEETIVAQGEKNERLFFITQGSIKVSHRICGRELFITSLNRGQIAGENFFTPSFWTVSLTTLTPARIYVLQQQALTAWEEKIPGLRTRLHAFYTAGNNIGAMLAKKGLERRQDQRFTLSRKIQVQPICDLNRPEGRGFRAETVDISRGGLAFLIRISKKENARLLLGRRIEVVLPVGGRDRALSLQGLVIGIQPFHLLENDYSVHLRFDRPLESPDLENILG